MTSCRWDPDHLRTRFVRALSDMYRDEVPQYGTLVDIVRKVDRSTLAERGHPTQGLPLRHELERHGAIRLGTNHELHTIRRLFAILGMYPVGYYDLGVVGFPLHATAFRPMNEPSLQKNPFRVFTTLLRRNKLPTRINVLADEILSRRHLFTDRLLKILGRAESGEIMTATDATDLVFEALKIFKWHSKSVATIDEYLLLNQEHPMVADIVCFPSAHINHLTPRTLDIDRVQKQMVKQGLPAKERIEGPPARQCQILLRQTSFKALEEHVVFATANGASARGTHTARFGEVEQRGAAVTRKGRELYDRLLESATHAEASASKISDSPHSEQLDTELEETFARHYPDTWSELRAQQLVYFRYTTSSDSHQASRISNLESQSMSLDHLVAVGRVEYTPITYEDFLPFSAAGIFKSNLGDDPQGGAKATSPIANEDRGKVSADKESFRIALGCDFLDEFELYSALEQESIKQCAKELGLREITLS